MVIEHGTKVSKLVATSAHPSAEPSDLGSRMCPGDPPTLSGSEVPISPSRASGPKTPLKMPTFGVFHQLGARAATASAERSDPGTRQCQVDSPDLRPYEFRVDGSSLRGRKLLPMLPIVRAFGFVLVFSRGNRIPLGRAI